MLVKDNYVVGLVPVRFMQAWLWALGGIADSCMLRSHFDTTNISYDTNCTQLYINDIPWKFKRVFRDAL